MKDKNLPTLDEMIGLDKFNLTDSQKQDCRSSANHWGFEEAIRQAKIFQQKNMKTKTQNRAAYEYDLDICGLDGTILWIKDLGAAKSVTNDIENILEDIAGEHNSNLNLAKLKIMYQDSMGTWDGIKITMQHPFRVEFFSINEKKYNKAKEKILCTYP